MRLMRFEDGNHSLGYQALLFGRASWLTSFIGTVLLLSFGSGFGSHFLVRELEGRYVNDDIDSVPAAPVIVVLGGGLANVKGPSGAIQLGPHVQRLWKAAELYRARKAPLILVSGGRIGLLPGTDLAESELAARVLTAWGIPASAILTEEGSLTTHENAVFTSRILMRKGVDRILLVTSAIHMPRATATFRRTGLSVIPVPADFLIGNERLNLLSFLIPNFDNLKDCATAIKEFVGIADYRLHGWAI